MKWVLVYAILYSGGPPHPQVTIQRFTTLEACQESIKVLDRALDNVSRSNRSHARCILDSEDLD